MPVDQSPQATQRRPYTEKFRSLGHRERRQERILLKQLYDQHRLTIRQIADLVNASYGFIHARLTEAGASTSNHRRTRPPLSPQATATVAALPTSHLTTICPRPPIRSPHIDPSPR
ncbi:hypothetical protein Asp14428_32980 [Actinoplanes sp. NBRC 14428]|nr:hypothetical protein Asp14428_32980 [Actinoplanes sp. NBRC 14428]